jgi:hypothetical protein
LGDWRLIAFQRGNVRIEGILGTLKTVAIRHPADRVKA